MLVHVQLEMTHKHCILLRKKDIRCDLAHQLEKASRSISNNYHEGFATRFTGEKLKFFDYAKRSAAEVRGMLKERKYYSAVSSQEIQELDSILKEIDTQFIKLISFFKKRKGQV